MCGGTGPSRCDSLEACQRVAVRLLHTEFVVPAKTKLIEGEVRQHVFGVSFRDTDSGDSTEPLNSGARIFSVFLYPATPSLPCPPPGSLVADSLGRQVCYGQDATLAQADFIIGRLRYRIWATPSARPDGFQSWTIGLVSRFANH